MSKPCLPITVQNAALYKPLISVVLPVYNHARFLRASVDSILAERDWPIEVIIVDDGSTDSPADVLEDLRSNPCLRLIRQENKGLSGALNKGFETARGTFLTWTSADNLYLPGALFELAEFLRSNPTVDLVYADVELIDDRGCALLQSHYRPQNQRPAAPSQLSLPRAAETLTELNDNFINACFLYRRSAATIVGEYDVGKPGYEDYDYWLRLSTFGRIAHLDTDAPRYQYRVHEQTLTNDLGSSVLSANQRESVLQAAKLKRAIRVASAAVSAAVPAGQDVGLETARAPVPGGPRPTGVRQLEEFAKWRAPATLTRYLATASPFPLRFGSEKCAPGSPTAVLLPPLRFPPLLKRARDDNHGAVTPEPGSVRSALVLLPDGAGNEYGTALLDAVKTGRSVTWVLFARSSEQRALADSVNLGLSGQTNLRILDVSAEAALDWDAPSLQLFDNTPWQERSLMYALSGVDLLFTILSRAENPDGLFLLRASLLAGAAAARPVAAWVLESSPDGLSSASDSRLILRGSATEAGALLRSLVFDAPHLSVSMRSDAAPGGLERALLELNRELELDSLEQWLQRQSIEEYQRRICALRYFAPV